MIPVNHQQTTADKPLAQSKKWKTKTDGRWALRGGWRLVTARRWLATLV